MTIHPPKKISSKEGLGNGTTKQIRYINKGLAIGTEIWNETVEPWSESGVTIAMPGFRWITKWEVGKPYIIIKFFDEQNNLVGIYCDVCRPVTVDGAGFRFEDLYLDVWQTPDAKPIILDQDELSEAVKAGYISEEEAARARQTAGIIVDSIEKDSSFLDY